MVVDTDWMRSAKCYDTWPALDMIDMDPGQSPQPYIEEYCDRCPVVLQCAQLALSDRQTVGIWGGVHIPFPTKDAKRRRAAFRALRERVAILSSSEHAA